MFTVRSTDTAYNSPLIGNGEVVTTVGPTGYHNGFCPAEEVVNRTIFWAGRRLSDARTANIRIPRVPPEELIGPTIPLIRLGRLARMLTINGAATTDDTWEQTMDFDQGAVISTLTHGAIREQTRSLVCLTANLLVFHTRLENQGDQAIQLEFALTYDFGDADGQLPQGTRLHIRRPHPDDLTFGNVEGVRSLDTDLDKRPPHLQESLSVQYEVESHLGEVHLGRYPLGVIRHTETGGRFVHQLELAPGQAEEMWFWVMLSDRLKYTHFPDFERVTALVAAHEQAWADFWNTSRVEFGHPELEALRTSCLYTIRCNASPWTIPPGYLSTHWEGRTFHDEFYPFMALISGNYPDLAERVPNYRLLTLPVAEQRGAGQGAYYGWEVTEDGRESAPYGHWTDEQFRHGQISESAWRLYLHTGNAELLARYYPVIRGCAEWLIHDALVRDEAGQLKTRTMTDINEEAYPVDNSIFVACATVRTLENAARAAEMLDTDATRRETWRSLAAELRQNLPLDETGRRYRYADNIDIRPSSAHTAMVFPFSFDVNGERALETLAWVFQAFEQGQTTTDPELVFSDNWIWALGRLAAACSYQGRGDAGLTVLRHAPAVTGPFMAPNEHFRTDEGPFLPWFTTGAGAFVYALHAMFVQVVDESSPVLCFGLPTAVPRASFERLLATQGVRVSGQIQDGKLVSLTAESDRAVEWSFRMPQQIASAAQFVAGVTLSEPDSHGLSTVACTLNKGNNRLV